MLAEGDGFQEVLCGCQEASGQVVGSSTGSLTCTVPVGTQIFFIYMATRLRHQIIPSNGTSFPASQISIPAAKPPILTHSFTLNVAGSFGYTDTYDSGIVGTFIAQ
jgi:hypothetical protein